MCAMNARNCSILDTCSEDKPQSELSEWYVSYGFSCRGMAKILVLLHWDFRGTKLRIGRYDATQPPQRCARFLGLTVLEETSTSSMIV